MTPMINLEELLEMEQNEVNARIAYETHIQQQELVQSLIDQTVDAWLADTEGRHVKSTLLGELLSRCDVKLVPIAIEQAHAYGWC